MDHKCWELPSNANKRPKNWKSKIGVEAANIAHDGRASTNVELLLSNMDEHMNYGQNDESLLMDPNIWIGDSAATVHMSPHEEGMTNMKKIRGGITVGNGEVMVAKVSGDIPCVVQDIHGKSVTKALISDVVLTKGTPFNLFSLTKMINQGWILGGKNNTGITLKKGDNVLSFDIPIKTPGGIVCAMKIRRNKGKDPSASDPMNNKIAATEGTERDIPNTNLNLRKSEAGKKKRNSDAKKKAMQQRKATSTFHSRLNFHGDEQVTKNTINPKWKSVLHDFATDGKDDHD
jgi:hypothetical protein